MSTEHFTVDAALLEELGERLIGRPHIALAELVKNAYDADASTCRIVFAKDRIEVIDDGEGMDATEFKNFWLRIGTRHKVAEETSKTLGRPLTGSKGVGRLAVQFLATRLDLVTTKRRRNPISVKADVNWSNIKRGADLHSFPVEVSEGVSPANYPNGSRCGTKLTLIGLRTDWTTAQLEELGRELWMLRSPFRSRGDRSLTLTAEDFDVELEAPDLEGAQEKFDTVQRALTESLWKARITGTISNGRTSDHAKIDVEFRSNYPSNAPHRSYSDSVKLSGLGPVRKPLLDRVAFTIFVYRLERQQSERVPLFQLKEYLKTFGNVSIYDSGFRLPYYGAGHDWLQLEEVHSSRLSTSDLLPTKWDIAERYMLDIPTTRRIFGAVDIDTSHEERAAREFGARPDERLQIQPGRDRLHLNAAHDQLTDLVRYALDLYANRYKARSVAAVERTRVQEPASRKQERVVAVLERHQDVIPAPVFRELRREAADAQSAAKSVESEYDARSVLLAPLAAAGMTALATTHELGREARSLERTRRKLVKLATDHNLPDLKEAADELASSLSRIRSLQSLFTPLLTAEDREGDTRLRVQPIVEQVVQAMRPLTPGLQVKIDVPGDLRFPPGPLASWSAVLQNVIANSWNAVLGSGKLELGIEGNVNADTQWIWISDSGVGLGMPLSEAAQLFEPFERRLEVENDRRSLALGGQGLGLTIVRMICRRHGVEPEFVGAEEGYATTLQLLWRG